MGKKPSLGRQKIAIVKIPKKNHLQVTFSKRRSGLFKKASELCTLCGVDIAIIVFSPANKAFSFGHPEVDTVIDRFLARRQKPADSGPACQILEAHRNANVRDLNALLTQLLNQIEVERKSGEELDELRRANEKQFWWELPIDGLGLGELEQLKMAMEELKKNVIDQTNKLVSDQGNGLSFFGVNNGRMQLQGYEDILETKPPLDVNGASTFSHFPNFHQGNGIF